MIVRSALAALAAGLFLSLLAGSAAATPACNERPCVIRSDPGGVITQYEALARRMVRTREPVQIKGGCYSACTILADQARPFVCVWPSATLYIHQASQISFPAGTVRRFPVTYSADIAKWIDHHGGQPTDGWLVMDYQQARRFWPLCND